MPRVSNNWLLSKIALVYVEVIRSTPLLVQLLFWYFGVIAALPDVKEAAELGGLGFFSNRGVFITWPYLDRDGDALALVAARRRCWPVLSAAWLRRRQLERQGLPGSGFLLGVVVFFIVAICWLFCAPSAGAPARQHCL